MLLSLLAFAALAHSHPVFNHPELMYRTEDVFDEDAGPIHFVEHQDEEFLEDSLIPNARFDPIILSDIQSPIDSIKDMDDIEDLEDDLGISEKTKSGPVSWRDLNKAMRDDEDIAENEAEAEEEEADDEDDNETEKDDEDEEESDDDLDKPDDDLEEPDSRESRLLYSTSSGINDSYGWYGWPGAHDGKYHRHHSHHNHHHGNHPTYHHGFYTGYY